MQVTRMRVLWLMILGCCLATWACSVPVALAQEEKVAEAPAAEAAPPAVDLATLPPYETGISPPDLAKPLWPDPTGGAAGTWSTPSAPPAGDGDPKTKTIPELYDRITHNLYSINMVWTLIAGFLVMFMQAGFAMVEGGLCRAKNASHTFAMNMMIYPLGCIAFWAYGFAIGWGNWYNGTGRRRLVCLVGSRLIAAQRRMGNRTE